MMNNFSDVNMSDDKAKENEYFSGKRSVILPITNKNYGHICSKIKTAFVAVQLK